LFPYVLCFLIAFVVSVGATFVVRAVARRLGLIARPRADRWHSRPTALYGGVGIYAGLLAGFVVLRLSPFAAPEGSGLGLLMLCATFMFVLGLVDDRVHLKPQTKLAFQIFICTLFCRYGLRLRWLPSEVLDQGLTLFWLVGITNALNLLDNIDGLAGGVAAIGGLFLVVLCHGAAEPGHAALCAAVCGAAAGFLVFNVNPASIFMGDCGSLLLGFFLSGMALVNNQPGGRRNLLAVLMVPVLLLLLPILDTSLVTVSRKLAGRSISTGGRDHTSHRLVALGLSERTATFTLWTLAALSGGVALFVRSVSLFISLAVVALVIMAFLLIMIFLGRVKVYEPVDQEGVDSPAARGRTLLPTLADFTYKRRIFEMAGDLVLILVSYYLAFLLRFDGQLPEPFYSQFLRTLPILICVQLGAFLFTGLYRGVWRYTNLADMILQLRAVTLAVSLSALVVLLAFDGGISRAVFAIDAMLLMLCVGGSRLSFRLMHAWVVRRRRLEGRQRVLIYGAGDRGELVVQELHNNQGLGLHPVGFIDDDPRKQGRVIHGLRVLGHGDELQALISEEGATEVIISTGYISGARMAEVERACSAAGARLRHMRVSLD
jgi:UDP-GlcNAc:undecaprenyl-phosphate GlcNAc-1-phosphate transferase